MGTCQSNAITRSLQEKEEEINGLTLKLRKLQRCHLQLEDENHRLQVVVGKLFSEKRNLRKIVATQNIELKMSVLFKASLSLSEKTVGPDMVKFTIEPLDFNVIADTTRDAVIACAASKYNLTIVDILQRLDACRDDIRNDSKNLMMQVGGDVVNSDISSLLQLVDPAILPDGSFLEFVRNCILLTFHGNLGRMHTPKGV